MTKLTTRLPNPTDQPRIEDRNQIKLVVPSRPLVDCCIFEQKQQCRFDCQLYTVCRTVYWDVPTKSGMGGNPSCSFDGVAPTCLTHAPGVSKRVKKVSKTCNEQYVALGYSQVWCGGVQVVYPCFQFSILCLLFFLRIAACQSSGSTKSCIETVSMERLNIIARGLLKQGITLGCIISG